MAVSGSMPGGSVPGQTEEKLSPEQAIIDSLYQSKLSRRMAVAGWSLFDFAMTIFSLNIISRYFALWVKDDKGQEDIVYSLTFSASLLIVAISSPALGTLSDRYGRRLPSLFVLLVIICLALVLIGATDNLALGLILFVIANYAYQSTQVFFNALLFYLSTPATRGKVGGIGQAVGYLGALSGLFMVAPFVQKASDGKVLHVTAFIPTAVLVFVFALPIFFFVREPKVKPQDKKSVGQLVNESFTQTIRSLRRASKLPNLFRFLLARLFYADAANTTVAFMAVYATKAIGMSDDEVTIVLALGILFSVVGAFGFGFLADRIGPKKTLYVVLAGWLVVLIAAIATHEKAFFYPIAALVGISLGGLRTTDRTYLITVAPPAMLGEAFGLYGLIGEFSSIIGPILWGVVTYAMSEERTSFAPDVKYRVAVGTLVILLLIGWLILRKAHDRRGTNEEMAVLD